MTPKLTGLALRFVVDGLLSNEQAEQVLNEARKKQQPFLHYCVEQQLIDPSKAAMAAADEFGLPLFDLNAMDPEQLAKESIERKLVEKHRIIPLYKRGKRLILGVSDPSNPAVVDEIKFATGLQIELLVLEHNKVQALIEKLYDDSSKMLAEFNEDELANLENVNSQEEQKADLNDPSTEAPVVKFVNQMLLTAIKRGASDLHFEPYEKTYRVRFRVDGVLETVNKPPVALAPKISARLKVISGMDIAERRVPQDGRIKLKVSANKSIDFRVNTLPTLWGEKIVLRILDASAAKMGIDSLGYEPEQKEMYLSALSKPQGMILVTGPTGSGKTVSLYTGLNILNTEGVNISTAEDPVEINLEGINQVNVRPKVGLDFAEALKSFLRQDPDIIMVGEIRDLETASIAIKAAQTGHMVMSTLHTNSAGETITRLLNMGVPSFNLATTVNLIIAQRLARRLCNHCKKPANYPKEALLKQGFTEAMLAKGQIFEPVGCDKCNNGYKGRVGIYEVVKITPAVSRIIMEEGNALQLNEQFGKEGFNSLRLSGLDKVAQGVTSLQEVNRVTID